MDLVRTVQRSIEQYETRLEHVRVRRINRDSPKIELEITGQVKEPGHRGNRLRLQTELSRSGHVQVA